MPRLFLILPAVIFSVLALLFAKGMTLDPNTLPSHLLDKPLPDFQLPSLTDPGRIVSARELHGPALVNFWASWCAPCRDEHALLADLARNSGVTLYGIDYADQRQDALAWLEEFGNPYRLVLFDERGSLGAEFRLIGTPETYLVDGRGLVRYRHAAQ